MNKVDEYYNKLLAIANLKYKDMKSLSLNYDIKDIIKRVINAGNEFILAEEYLYCFVLRALDSDNFNDVLAVSLRYFTTNDQNKIIDKLVDLYDEIYYINELDIFYNNLTKLGDFIEKDKIPLLGEFRGINNSIDDDLNTSDYFLIRDVVSMILAYCVLNKKEESFIEYCTPYIEHPEVIIETLLLNGIITETVNDNTNEIEYVVINEELIKYITSKINNDAKKLIK